MREGGGFEAGVTVSFHVTLEGGTSGDTAWFCTTVAEPPWASISRPLQVSTIRPCSPLLSPRWISAVVCYAKDSKKATRAEATATCADMSPNKSKKVAAGAAQLMSQAAKDRATE